MDSLPIQTLAQTTEPAPPNQLQEYFSSLLETVSRDIIGDEILTQVMVIAGILAVAFAIRLLLHPLLKRLAVQAEGTTTPWVSDSTLWLRTMLFRILATAMLWIASYSFDQYNNDQAEIQRVQLSAQMQKLNVENRSGQVVLRQQDRSVTPEDIVAKNYSLIRVFASLFLLWLLHGAMPARLRKQVYFKILFIMIATALLLNLVGIWGTFSERLNNLRILPLSDYKETKITLLTLLKGIIFIMIIVPFSGWLMRVTESRVDAMKQGSPVIKVLLTKTAKIGIILIGGLFAISAFGVNLATFTLFGGAIGLGLGFGFQKVISNLISGVILLGDRSIKPGDVIEVDETYGWINTLSARYASVITRDGTEHLIPNETLITEKVVNWSFSDDKVRLKSDFGISYASDIHEAMELALQAAKEHERVIDLPAPTCRLKEFGDNSINFQLIVWLRDPANGINGLRSDLYIRIWDLFKENNVEFPFPQRDLHLKQAPTLEVKLKKD